MDGDDHTGPSFTWEVGPDLIDLDHWARSYLAVRVDEQAGRSPAARVGWLAVAALGLVALGALTSIAWAVGVAVVFAVVAVGVRLANRHAATRLAQQMRDLPATSEPFTFRADPTGTHSQSASSSEHLTWSRWRSVRTHDDLVVLTLDSDALLLLPIEGLVPAQPVSTVVGAIERWIDGARSDPGAPTTR